MRTAKLDCKRALDETITYAEAAERIGIERFVRHDEIVPHQFKLRILTAHGLKRQAGETNKFYVEWAILQVIQGKHVETSGRLIELQRAAPVNIAETGLSNGR